MKLKTCCFRLCYWALGVCFLLHVIEPVFAQQQPVAPPDLKGYWEVVSGPKNWVGGILEITKVGTDYQMDLQNGVVLRGPLNGKTLNLTYRWTLAAAYTHLYKSEGDGAALEAAIRALAGTKVNVDGMLDDNNFSIDFTYKEQKEEAFISKDGQTITQPKPVVTQKFSLRSIQLNLRILLTADACKHLPDQFILKGGPDLARTPALMRTNGLEQYSSTLTLPTDMTIIDGEPYLVFRGVRPDWNYTLTVSDANKQEDTLFTNVPFSALGNVTRFAEDDPKDVIPAPPGGFTGVDSFAPYFSALPAKQDGSGDYHVNRYRVYFRSRWVLRAKSGPAPQPKLPVVIPIGKQDLSALVSQFNRDFALFFNGGQSGVITDGISAVEWRPTAGRKFWQPNLASVAKTTLLNADGKAFTALGFQMHVNGPEIHNDWVAVIWRDPSRGFAVQTLHRLQPDWSKTKSMTTVGVGGAIVTAATLGTGLVPVLVGAGVFTHYNDDHFLAGRRSWVLGHADDEFGRVDFGGADYYYLETAAVERYSSWVHRYITSNDPGVVANVRNAINAIWITLLRNYLEANGFKSVPIPGNIGWQRQDQVNYLTKDYATPEELEADSVGQDVLKMHPALNPE